MSDWHQFHNDFRALMDDEKREVQQTAPQHYMRAYGSYLGTGDVGEWTLAQIISESLGARFELCCTKAGDALKVTAQAKLCHYWLHRLYTHLRERESDHVRIDGVIERVIEASSSYCAHLEIKQIESTTPEPNEIRLSPKAQANLIAIHVRWQERDNSVVHHDPALGFTVKKSHTDLFSLSCREAYDVIAEDQEEAANFLSDVTLTSRIPATIFDLAVKNRWYTITIQKPREAPSLFPSPYLGDTSNWLGDLPERMGFASRKSARIAGPTPLVPLGSHQVAQGIHDGFLNLLAGRIEHWKARRSPLTKTIEIVLADDLRFRDTITPLPESVGYQIEKLRNESRMPVEELATLIERDSTTVSRHIAGKLIPQIRTIGAYERVFSKALNRKVVISITPAKRR